MAATNSEVVEILVVFEEMKENLFKCDVCDFGEGTDVELADI